MAESKQLFEQFNLQITQITQTFAQQFQQTLTAIVQYDKNNDLDVVVQDFKEEESHQWQLQIQQEDDRVIPEAGEHKDLLARIEDPSSLVYQVCVEPIQDKVIFVSNSDSSSHNLADDSTGVVAFCINTKACSVANNVFDENTHRESNQLKQVTGENMEHVSKVFDKKLEPGITNHQNEIKGDGVTIVDVFDPGGKMVSCFSCKKKNYMDRPSSSIVNHECSVLTLQGTMSHIVPAVEFLPSGQSRKEATMNLNAMNKQQTKKPQGFYFAFGRPLQQSTFKAWAEKQKNRKKFQDASLIRCKAKSEAIFGKYLGGGGALSEGAAKNPRVRNFHAYTTSIPKGLAKSIEMCVSGCFNDKELGIDKDKSEEVLTYRGYKMVPHVLVFSSEILKFYECYAFDQLNCMVGCLFLVPWNSALLSFIRVVALIFLGT